jgi:hypothetical protein
MISYHFHNLLIRGVDHVRNFCLDTFPVLGGWYTSDMATQPILGLQANHQRGNRPDRRRDIVHDEQK